MEQEGHMEARPEDQAKSCHGAEGTYGGQAGGSGESVW
jgi:hypothetical protein